MTQQHPITPPPELVQQWVAEIWHEGTPVRVAASDIHIATQAARWGADRELEACCKWLERNFDDWDTRFSVELRAARRPKPPSLKEQALVTLEDMRNGWIADQGEFDLIRRALEALDD